MRHLTTILALVAVTFAPMSFAEFRFVITKGYDQATEVAITNFCWDGERILPEDISSIVYSDLERTGQFKRPSGPLIANPCNPEDVYFRDWRLQGPDYLVIGNIEQDSVTKKYIVNYRLYDVFREMNIHHARITGSENQLRDMAHMVSDAIYEKMSGVKGAFNTKLAYVTHNRTEDGPVYNLEISDADGHRQKVIYKSAQSIISPAWSADGRNIAFTTFSEKGRTSIKIANRITGQITSLPSYKGINSGAAFSPDGKSLAFVNSQTGNADIYVMNLETKKVKQLTSHWAIDTEPSWSPDGKKLLFTSERGGRPQIYQLTLDTGAVERLTFEGSFNARAHYSSDGKHIVMVHQSSGVFHVAALNTETRELKVLSETDLDESPSIAPNGTMLIYATQQKNKGVLAWASLDGEIASIMPAERGHVREPAWSPYLR